MDLDSYSLEDLILSALKSETDASAIYSRIADGIKNALLKERLKFIAAEEERHREFMEGLYKKQFPDKQLVLPDSTPVPLPEIKIENEQVSPVQIFESAMEAELAANKFYLAFAERFENETDVKKMLIYFATMEMGHYRLFELEKENMEKYEEFDFEWPMMHVGP
jgi:rubrerythrin